MVINITQEHIDNGMPNHATHCMLGLAIWEQAIKPNRELIVDWEIFYEQSLHIETIEHGWITVEVPEAAVKLAQTFDHGDRSKIKPFSFELPIDELLNGGE